jgi:hypothetical protein
LLPFSESTSERIAYAMFLAIVKARPTTPLPSSSAAAHEWPPIAATVPPITVSRNEKACHLIEWGRNANGCTSVRYTEGNAAVPHTPALIFVPHNDRTNGSGL